MLWEFDKGENAVSLIGNLQKHVEKLSFLNGKCIFVFQVQMKRQEHEFSRWNEKRSVVFL